MRGRNLRNFCGKNFRRFVSIMLSIAIIFTSMGFEQFTKEAEAAAVYTTLYLVDDTPEHWIGNDNAVIELVDNTYGHTHYMMTRENSNTWSVRVPSTTFNVTFNRLSPDRSVQWNSWSAGGRNGHSTYHAITHEHGYWDGTAVSEEGFHAGDVVYLDFYEFNNWKQATAMFYVNFTSYAKETDGKDIDISSADHTKFSPIELLNEIEEDVFTYTVTEAEEGSTELKFWRGDSSTLWNYSVTLRYTDYKAGNNCVKIQGWDDTGYVCPYVPRRHITQIDSIELNVTGNRKINRKIEIDLNITGETELLDTEQTIINITKENENGGEEVSDEDTDTEGCHTVLYDDGAAEWNHRELIFTEPGTYTISAIATDGTDNFETQTTVVIADDLAPMADFVFDNDSHIYTRNETGTAYVNITDHSASEAGDEIISRTYDIYYDANLDGVYDEEERIDTIEGNETEITLQLTDVGMYKVVLRVQEHFEDTIESLIDESAYLGGSTEGREDEDVTFEIANVAPRTSMSVRRSKLADIIFTVGNADSDKLNEYVYATQQVKEYLKELGIQANVSTVSTSSLTAQDTFAWEEYDHYNYVDSYLPTIPKHIIYDGKDIVMKGYSWAPLKDFLYVADEDSSRKVFEFDLQRDATDWHSMEGGGFLFNTAISEEENYIQGYCILVTQSGLKLVQINKTNLINFSNGSYPSVQNAGKLLRTFPISNLYANHHFKIIVDRNIITVYDDDSLVIDEYVLPDNGVNAYGYGPIISHASHACGQQSYFTFKNIVMQTITGESLSDVVNNHEWTPGTNHYVINLSDTSVPELSDTDRLADVAAALMQNDVMFYGIGNDTTIDEYNLLINVLDGKGSNIQLRNNANVGTDGAESAEDRTEESEEENRDEVTVSDAVDNIVSQIAADVRSKDYSIGYTIASDELVEYTGTYYDPDGDVQGEEEWVYVYDNSVFGENNRGDSDGNESGGSVSDDNPQTIYASEPITMFEQTGAYEIRLRVSDNPTKGNAALASYIKWSQTDEYQKLILSQHRPVAALSATVMQAEGSTDTCMVNVTYHAFDADHPSDDRQGIREEQFSYKEMNDTTWTEGRLPSYVPMGKTYLVKYVVTDIEGTVSRPAVCVVKTNDARTYTEPEDDTPPEIQLSVNVSTIEVNQTFYIEASATDDYGVESFRIVVNDEEIGTIYGRFGYTPDETGEFTITATATDICGNTATETRTVSVIDRSDVTPPVIEITSPNSGTITGNVDIIGSITDNKELKSYTVSMSKVSTDAEEPEENVVILANGTEEIVNEKIAEIDTDELENGVYKVEITAIDSAGLTSTVTLLITVEESVSDRIPPQASISDIILEAGNNKIQIFGSMSDETEFGGYELNFCDVNNESVKTVIASGTVPVVNDIIGEILTDSLYDGSYIVKLKVWDAAGNTCETGAGFTYTKGSDDEDEFDRNPDMEAPIIAGDLTPSITEEGLHLKLSGTITDENLKEYTVVTGKSNQSGDMISQTVMGHGTTAVVEDVIAEYTYAEYEEGDYIVRVRAEDFAGNIRTLVYTVTVTKNGTIKDGYEGETENPDNPDDPNNDTETGNLNLVLSNTVANLGDTLHAYLTYPASATNVKLIADGSFVTLYGRTADIVASSTGEIEVILSVVIDGEEKTVSQKIRVYDRSDVTHPEAYFITPEADSEIKTKTEITGTAVDETSLAYYLLEYRMEGTDEYRQIRYSTEPVTEGVLGELDTTLLDNGRYLLRLTVVDNGGNRVRVERSINVTGNLKVGNMFLSFTDINSNVAGIPLSVTRNYSSTNKSSGDFGTGWSLGIQGAKLIESSDITQGYSLVQQGTMLSTGYYMTQTVCHDITVTYGDGTSDRFELKVTPERQALIPIYEVKVTFVCVTDSNVKLQIDGDNTALVYGNQLVFLDNDTFESNSYVLTRKDGTKLYFNSEYGLLKMEDSNGNTVSITKNGFKHSDGKGVTFTRDSQGRIIKAQETDSFGNEITSMTYGYDSRDNLIAVTDDAGRTVMFTYDDDHNLIDIIDPSGIAVARNVYDEQGRLIATIDADGNRTEYEHDIDGRTETVRDKMGNVTVYTYDDNGNILQTVDALGNRTVNTYDENNNVLTKTDALGNVTTYEYDANDNQIRQVSADGTEEKFIYNSSNLVNSVSVQDIDKLLLEYDSRNNITSTIDANGNKTEYQYESNGNLKSISDEIGVYRRYTYDNNGRLASMSDSNGNIVNYVYNEKGYLISKSTINHTDNQVISVTYHNDEAGNVTQEIAEDGTITFFEYNVNNQLTSQTDSLNRRTDYSYDNNGNLTTIQYPDGTTDNFTYDAMGNTVGILDRNGISSTMVYDKLGRLSKIMYANGTEESYQYDSVGNVIKHKSTSGAVTSYEYDALYRNTAVIDAFGNRTSYEYNDFSQLVKITDAQGNIYRYEYDYNGNQTKIIYPDNTSVSFAFDSRNRKVSETDAAGNRTLYEYDGNDNLTKVVDATGNQTVYEYDQFNNLSKIIDANGNFTNYVYDNMSRLYSVQDMQGNTITYGYDDAGRLVQVTDKCGNAATYTYNEQDLLIKEQNHDGSIIYTYNDLNQLISVADNNGIIRYTYDAFDRMLSKTMYDDVIIRYRYDEFNRLECKKLIIDNVEKNSTTYEYDILDRITRVVDRNGTATVYEYDALGNRKAVTYANGEKLVYTYDACSRLKEECVTDKDNVLLYKYVYDRDSKGNVVKIVELSGDNQIVTEYQYDDIYRLIGEEISTNEGSISISYVYDGVGNRLEKCVEFSGDISFIIETDSDYCNVTEGRVLYSYNSLNQLVSEVNGTGECSYIYDRNGNLIRSIKAGCTTEYTYDAKNQLLKASKFYGENSEETETYSYDYAGNRIRKTSGTDTILYVIDDNTNLAQIEAELTENHEISILYNRGQELVSMENTSGVLYYIYDGHGDVRALVNNDGDVTDTYRYDSYGNLLRKTGTTDNKYLYTGQYYDDSTGLYYLRARYADLSNGNFLTMDTYDGDVYEPASLHKYLYTQANPVTYTDPSGHFALALGMTAEAELRTQQISYDATIMRIGMSLLAAIRLFKEVYNAVSISYDVIGMVIDDINWITAVASESVEEIKARLESKLATVSISKRGDGNIYTVYTLMDSNKIERYVGRTKDYKTRIKAHYRPDGVAKKYNLVACQKIDNLTYEVCRAYEQMLMVSIHTRNWLGEAGYNMINGISPTNPKKDLYAYELLTYIENQVDNERLNLEEKFMNPWW